MVIKKVTIKSLNAEIKKLNLRINKQDRIITNLILDNKKLEEKILLAEDRLMQRMDTYGVGVQNVYEEFVKISRFKEILEIDSDKTEKVKKLLELLD